MSTTDATTDAVKAVRRYYDYPVAFRPALGVGLVGYLAMADDGELSDHLSPMVFNDDYYALQSDNWRAGICKRVLQLAAAMGIARSDRVLDLGCGVGGPGRDVAVATGCEVVGVTLSAAQAESLLAISADRRSVYNMVVIADMQQLPFPRAMFNHVMSINAAYHAPHAARVIDEAWRVLAPGGTFGLDDWFTTSKTNPRVHQELRYTWSAPVGFHRLDSVSAALIARGFKVEFRRDLSAEAGAFLSEPRFGAIFDAQVRDRLHRAFIELYPEQESKWARVAASDLRRAALRMGELYRTGQASYCQIVARKPEGKLDDDDSAGAANADSRGSAGRIS